MAPFFDCPLAGVSRWSVSGAWTLARPVPERATWEAGRVSVRPEEGVFQVE